MDAHEPSARASAREVETALRAALRGRSAVQLALLFGSYARGTQRPDSDVDVAVLAPGMDRLELAAALSLAAKREVHVAPIEQASYPLLQALLRDSIVLHEGKKGAAAEWRSSALLITLITDLDRPWFERMRDAYLKRLANGRGLSRG
jgi:predicted nucleotidyltransferase